MSEECPFFRRAILHVPRIAIVLIFLFGVLGVQSSCKLNTASADSNDSQTSADDDFDLGLCQRQCQGMRGDQVGKGVPVGQIPSCIQDCNDKSWKAFDRRMKELKELSIGK